ncbi:Outer membrane protein (porin) [Pasteurella testudinis DSM 23072]|uniref:Outer membrane protein (Porin) n=1 Tax=Pasteurella testudinis DSM 23072 TaxID=1122938 RepID=A0A1W1V205_9PAST|nr:porin [Pasteurella testudinis]SMB87051.1 Outer membrane protein (porin) [Pasteurella testudinis DSM 23072]SUB51700.1 major outer membrane protein OmpH-2 [Pasteurella testudinis]
MKKTLVALAVAAVAATSANAAVVYDQDGSKVEVGGSLRVLLNKVTDKRADLDNDGSRLQFKGTQDLGNGLSAIAALELRFRPENNAKSGQNSGSSFGDVNAERLWAGLKQDGVGTLSFGRQLTNGDSIQLANFINYKDGNVNLTDYADKSVKFVSDSFGGFSFGLDYIFGQDVKDETTLGKAANYKNGYGAALYYSGDLSQDVKFNFRSGYTQDRWDTVETTKRDSWRVAAEFVIDQVTFGYNYGQSRDTVNGTKDSKETYHMAGAQYRFSDPAALNLQWKRKSKGDDAVNTYIVGVDYKVHKNVYTFVEYHYDKVKNGENISDVGVGLRVFF